MKARKIFLIMFLAIMSFAEEAALNWEACVKEALANNPELKSAREKIFQAEKSMLATESNGAIQVSGSLSQSNSFPLTGGSYSESSGYSLSGRYQLYDGEQYSLDVLSAKETARAAKYSYETSSAAVRYNLKTAFLNLFKSQKLVDTTEDIRKRRKENYDMVKLNYDAGKEHKGSVLLAEANLSQADYEAAAAKRSRELASIKLVKQLGRKEDGFIKVSSDTEIKDTGKEKPDFKKLVENCPSYKQSLSQKIQAEYGLRSAQAAFSPQISLSASAGNSASNFAWGFPDKLSVGLGLSLQIFDGGKRTAQADKAASSVLQAELDLISSAFSLETSLFNAWITFQNAIDQAEVRKKFLDATTERSKISEVQYSNGLIAFDNWIIIEDDLVNSKKSLLDAQINSLSAENAWLNTQGKALEEDNKTTR